MCVCVCVNVRECVCEERVVCGVCGCVCCVCEESVCV